MRQNKYEYDAFISHAVEDKIPIANELCAKLEAAGLKVWYSGKELGIGDSIEKTIEKGLNRSRYGIVVFSPTYLAKNWTIREFYTLLAKEIEEHKVILPVLYNISLDELKNKDLVMADRFAVNADKGMDFVVERLVREIKKSSAVKVAVRPWLSKIRFFLLLSMLINVALLSRTALNSNAPGPTTPEVFVSAGYPNSATRGEALLGELQGLFSQLSGCTCTHDDNEAPLASLAGMPLINSSAQSPGFQAGTGEMDVLPAKKLTMAVIFQIETDASRAPQEEMRITTPGNRDEGASFMRVGNPASFPARHQTPCLHTAAVGE